MKRKSLITLVALALVTLLVTAYSRTPQAGDSKKVDFDSQSAGQGATGASPTTNVAALQTTNLKIPKISICLYFGRAKKNCGGWGICKLGSCSKIASAPRTVSAELSVVADGKLELRLLKKVPEEERTLFVDEDIPLSAEMAKQLGLKSATIQRGEYAFSASKSRLNARITNLRGNASGVGTSATPTPSQIIAN